MWRELPNLAATINERGVRILSAWLFDERRIYLVYPGDADGYEKRLAEYLIGDDDLEIRHFANRASFIGAPWA